MSIQVYSSGKLAFDSRLPEEKQYSMLSIHIKEGLNKGGTATLVLPPMHPHIDSFPAYAVPVEIYRNGVLRWRGRPLPSSSDIYGRRTVTCEGELCFLQDATHRPYAYKGKPDEIFHSLLAVYNATVEPWKRFVVGVVSVTSDEDIELTAKEPEKVFAAVSKLRQMCGGYILFDTALDGARRINWFKTLPYVCRQKIQLGYNLMDYSNQTDATAFATRIIPYGEFNENDVRLTIDIDGKDYVEDADAVALYGIVEKPVIYDGVTDPAVLEALARADLVAATSLPSTITLSAVDMSRVDTSIGSFAMGQTVEAESRPHNLSGRYDLVELEEDLVNPTVGSVTVTKDAATYTKGVGTLTGALHQQMQEIQMKPSQNAMDRAVAAATAWLTNGQGYKVERVDAAGNTVDTLYMDTPDINTAVNVLRIGQSGIGFSHNGVDGPYVSAWTIDGKFNADFLIGLLIKACRIESLSGKISIDLSDESKIPVFNTGISTNGLTVRGDAADAQKVFELDAVKGAATGTYFGRLRFNSTDGTTLFKLTETFADDILSGVLAEWLGRNSGISALVSAAKNQAGFWLRVGEDYKGHLLVDADGTSSLRVDKYNSKLTSWQPNGDGTYTLIGTDPT